MNRIDHAFATMAENSRKALIPYITAGDPEVGTTLQLMHALVDSGADILEIGIPFSDPMADGPVIQAACERALSTGITLADVLELVAEFRRKNNTTPVVLMGYLNPVEAMGYTQFAKRASQAGVDGVLLVDLSAEEAQDTVTTFEAQGLCTIFLVAPTSTQERVRSIGQLASGYLYYVSFKGVTGANRLDVDEVAERVAAIRQTVEIPVAVGFGIRDAASAAQVSRVADGVVVGSALVSRIGDLCHDEGAIVREVPEILRSMRKAMDAVTEA